MKILFVASNPKDEGPLSLASEITELQRRFIETAGEPVSFSFLPDLHVERFIAELARHKPDVLHISAHGAGEALALRNELGQNVYLTAEALAAFLPHDLLPRLVYLNACDSKEIADKLSRHPTIAVDMVIGATAPISNLAAQAGALSFYERILSGSSVGLAYEASKHIVGLLSDQQASMQLCARKGIDPSKQILHQIPRIIADFVDGVPICNAKGEYAIRFAVIGCPATTIQIVFFTDDKSFIKKDKNNGRATVSLEYRLCHVVQEVPIRGTVWMPETEPWEVSGDFRIFAACVKGDGSAFILATRLCDAIEMRYRLGPDGAIPNDIEVAVCVLRAENEADLSYSAKRAQLGVQSKPLHSSGPNLSKRRNNRR
jgi:hypothetical protein